MATIPFQDLPAFEQEVVLDNTSYVLKFVWNSYGEFWDLSFFNNLREPIVEGIKIVLNYELISRFHSYGLPPGELYALDLSGDKNKIQQRDFVNGRVTLTYVTEAEVEVL